mgnify:CR=1 FL=1
MSDGTKIAADIYLPVGSSSTEKFPTIFSQTRYHRSTLINFPFSLLAGDYPKEIKRFVSHGYAWVKIDVRGTGASFGKNLFPWFPRERQDGVEVVNWIVSQPWSNGKVGATGISYDGTAAEFLAASEHPAIKAIAPRYSLFDSYLDIAFPGGIHNRWFTRNWGDGNKALDQNELPNGLPPWFYLLSGGVRPVDEDSDGSMLRAALVEHKTNPNIGDQTATFQCRDDGAEIGFTSLDLSPFEISNKIAQTNIPVYSISGWWDGGYGLAAIERYLTIPNNGSRLLLGPWDHGGRQHISPGRNNREPAFDETKELLKFFDRYLKGIRNGIDEEPPIHYFTMVEEKWKSADQWPPDFDNNPFFMGPRHTLNSSPIYTTDTNSADLDQYEVNYSVGSGEGSRWKSLYNISGTEIEYPNEGSLITNSAFCNDGKLLCYTSPPLQEDLEVTGHPEIYINLSLTDQDGYVIVYLSDVPPEGDPEYVTEGQLRIAFSREQNEEPLYHSPAVMNSFNRRNAVKIAEGTVADLHFSLLPTSYRFKKGHKIRIILTGADKDLYTPLTNKPPKWTVFRSHQYPSRLVLPSPSKYKPDADLAVN